jgi:hypothetical protein
VDEPILRYVDLSTVHIGKAAKLVLPAWARTVLPGPGGAPLLYAGERAGQRIAVLAFEPRQSDLPLQVAFPILMANLSGELLGGSTAPTAAVVPGDPVSLPLPAGATGLTITRPDGTSIDLPAVGGATTIAFSQTEQLGVYTATPILPAPTTGPSGGAASAGPAATPGGSATATPGPSGGSTPPPADADAPIRFAVDLFDPDESDIAPGSPASIEALGPGGPGSSPGPSASPGASAGPSVGPGASGAPGASPAPGAGTTERRPARDELWVPIVLVALVVLAVEWLVYHRDAVTRIWRGLRRRGPSPEGRRG